MINMNTIPVDIRIPGNYIEIDNTKAYRGLSGIPTRVLVIGQKLAAGSQAALIPALMTGKDQAISYFGRGSMLAHMIERMKAANPFVEIHAIAQDDNVAGVAAAGSIAFNGAASEAGTLNVYIAGRRVQVAIAAADADTAQATKLANAINAATDLPVTAAVDGVNTKKVNITSRHKGECGNTLNIRVNYYQDERTPAGMTTTIVAMSGGSGNPLVANVIAAIGDAWFTDFVMPYTDTANLVAMEAELLERFGGLAMIDGHVFLGQSDTHANLITKGQSRNTPFASMMGAKGSPTPPYEWAAVLAAVSAFNLKNDPARPLQTLQLPGILPPVAADLFTMTERDLLLRNGISTFVVDAGSNVVIERVITMYRTNPFGAVDPSFLDIETMKTLAYLRFDLRNYMALTYPRYKLANDNTAFSRGDAVVTPSMIKASIISRFMLWEENGLVEDVQQFKADLLVERSTTDLNRVNALIPANIINQLRVFAGKIEFRL